MQLEYRETAQKTENQNKDGSATSKDDPIECTEKSHCSGTEQKLQIERSVVMVN